MIELPYMRSYIFGTIAIVISLTLILTLKQNESRLNDTNTNRNYSDVTEKNISLLISKLILREEKFYGIITSQFIDTNMNRVEIIIQNKYSGDDSIGIVEHQFIATKEEQMWKITQHTTRWTCRRNFLWQAISFMLGINIWTIKNCP